MKQVLLRFVALAFAAAPLFAGDAPPAPAKDVTAVYRERADKIVATLGLGDASTEKSLRVRDAIADHYRGTNAIDDAVEARLKEIKQQPASEKGAADAAIKAARDEAEPKLAELHAAFLKKLSADLTESQIEQVKDGLTYGVVQVTWNAYQKMYPNLTAEQKDQIMAWLKEAREHAMDAGSSDKKHAWFGKYKGRINNYLSKAGYNAKEAEKNLTKKP